MFLGTKLIVGLGLIAAFAVAIPVQALSQTQQRSAGESAGPLPEGQGKDLVEVVCSQCHALNIVTANRKTATEWEATVSDMIARGANISADEAKSITAYLGQHFRPGSRPAATPLEAGEAASAGFPPDGPGKEVLVAKCSQCHNENMWKSLRQDRRGWEATLYRMVGRGALWTEEEIGTMARYLATVFGPKGAGAAQSERRQR